MRHRQFEWRKTITENGMEKEKYISFPVKVEKAVDTDFGMGGNLICNQCNGKVKQTYICPSCGDQNTIGGITKRKIKVFRDGNEIEVVYEELAKKTFLEETRSDMIRVVEEIPASRFIKDGTRIADFYEMFNNDANYANAILSIYGYLDRNQKALIVDFCGEGGVLIAGRGELTLYKLRDSRLLRKPKQENIPQILDDTVTQTLDAVSEDTTPDRLEKFIDLVRTGTKIETPTVIEKPKIVVETSWLET